MLGLVLRYQILNVSSSKGIIFPVSGTFNILTLCIDMEILSVIKIKLKNIVHKCNNKIDDWRIYIWKISIKCVAIRGGGGGGRTSFIISVIMTWYKLLDTGHVVMVNLAKTGLPYWGWLDQTKEHIYNNLGLSRVDCWYFYNKNENNLSYIAKIRCFVKT